MNRFFLTSLLLILFTSISSAQWSMLEQDAYNPSAFPSYPNFTQKGDTLFSLASGNLYYSYNSGNSFGQFEENFSLDDISISDDTVFVTDNRKLYFLDNGMFSLYYSANADVYGVQKFNGKQYLMTRGGVMVRTSAGEYESIAETSVLQVNIWGVVNGTLFVYGYNSNSRAYSLFSSTDGTTFTEDTTYPAAVNFNKIAFFDGKFFSQSTDGIFMTSDGTNWTQIETDLVSDTDGIFSNIGDALVYGHGDDRYGNYEESHMYLLKGESTFKPIPMDRDVESVFQFLFATDGKIYLMDKPRNIYSYAYATDEFAFVKGAPRKGEYLHLGKTMMLLSEGGVQLYKRGYDEDRWQQTFEYVTTGSGYFIHAMIELESGRLLTSVNGNGIYYSDDGGENWEMTTGVQYSIEHFIARNDTIFGASQSQLIMSTDGGMNWEQKISGEGTSGLKYFGTNSLFMGRKVFSLDDFSSQISINTNQGTVQDYDTLNGFQYKATSQGLYQKAVTAGTFDNWTSLTSRFGTGSFQTNAIGVIAYKEVLVALTSNGVFYSSNDGELFEQFGTIGNIQTYTRADSMLYVYAYNPQSFGYNWYYVDMNNIKPLPVISTSEVLEQTRTDTLVNMSVSATIEPRDFEVSIYFEYGMYSGSGSYIYTHQTESETYLPQSDPFEATGWINALEPSTQYAFRPVLIYGDSVLVYGEGQTSLTRSKKLWERLDPVELGGNFRDVLVTRRGSIIAWGASGTIRSIDNGDSWEKLPEGDLIYSMIQIGEDTLFAGTTTGNFLYSTDEGGHWHATANDSLPSVFGGNKRIWDLANDPVNHIRYGLIGEKEFSTNNAVYLVKSLDGGNIWKEPLLTSLAPNGGVIEDLYVDSTGTLWVSSKAPLQGNSMLSKSVDFGETWEAVITSSGTSTRDSHELLEIGKDTLFINSSEGPFISYNGGTSFAFAVNGSENQIRSFGIGKKYAFSRKFGLISVNYSLTSFDEYGSISFALQKNDSLKFRSLRPRNFFGDFNEPDLSNGGEIIVRNTDVSSNDVVLLATNNGVWRYIPGESDLPENPNPEDVTIATSNNAKDSPQHFVLNQNYPNPFNPSTNIQFRIPEAAEVTLKVYNLLGQEVATLISEKLNAGSHSVQFNASALTSGVYMYRLASGNEVITRKMTLIK